MSFGMHKIAAGVIAGAAIAAFAVPASAGASGLVHRHSSSPGTLAGVASHHMTARQTATPDTFLAGWYSFTSGGLASASSTFRVPAAVCPTSDTTDLGFGVYGAQSGITDFGSQSQADVQIDCESGSVFTYISAYTVGGGNDFVPANPGDLVVTSLYENGSTTVATVHDLTTHVTVTSSGASTFDVASNTGAYNYFYPGSITAFGKVQFTKSQINGDYLGYTNPIQLKMKAAAPVQISAGALNAQGDGFTATFHHI